MDLGMVQWFLVPPVLYHVYSSFLLATASMPETPTVSWFRGQPDKPSNAIFRTFGLCLCRLTRLALGKPRVQQMVPEGLSGQRLSKMDIATFTMTSNITFPGRCVDEWNKKVTVNVELSDILRVINSSYIVSDGTNWPGCSAKCWIQTICKSL